MERLFATPKMTPVFPSSIPMTLELLARPAAEVRGGIVCRLEKIHQRALRRTRLPHRFIRQHEFAHLIVVVRFGRAYCDLAESVRFRIGIRVKRGIESHPTRPEPGTRHLVRIRLA